MSYVSQLHCGACHTNFDDDDALSEHLVSCGAAKAMLPVAVSLLFGRDSADHKKSTLFFQANKHASLIDRYAACIAYELSNMERGKVHSELCEKLGLSHFKFKPFEADEIDKLPTFDEAKAIIWRAIQREILSIE